VLEQIGETSWGSYPKIWNLGHRAAAELFDGPVIVEEKLDGSQFSFGKFNGELRVRSRGKQMDVEAPEKMFVRAVETVVAIEDLLRDGWTYRAEYLSKPKHNTLAYGRVPHNYLIILDINDGCQSYLPHKEKKNEAECLDLEVTPLLFEGVVESADQLREFMDRVSILGGQKIEGVVVKNYAKYGPDGKALMGKHVSEQFKEMHGKDWKLRHPGGKDIIEDIAGRFRTESRWEKAVQHLRERGELENSPRDIGPLLKEVNQDVLEECGDEIKELLWKWAWKRLSGKVTHGLPEWYKNKLMESQFEGDDPCSE